jgi:hypothetical protein
MIFHGAYLVGGAITILKNMSLSDCHWEKNIPYIMENNKCLKPTTRFYD